jgi:hypothetical protein
MAVAYEIWLLTQEFPGGSKSALRDHGSAVSHARAVGEGASEAETTGG